MFGNTALQEELERTQEALDKMTEERDELSSQIEDMEHDAEVAEEDHEREVERLRDDHRYEMKHFKDEELKKAVEMNTYLTKSMAVLENENKMLGQVMNVNKDIIDVKNLVSTLIEKLPTININGVMTPTAKAKK